MKTLLEIFVQVNMLNAELVLMKMAKILGQEAQNVGPEVQKHCSSGGPKKSDPAEGRRNCFHRKLYEKPKNVNSPKIQKIDP